MKPKAPKKKDPKPNCKTGEVRSDSLKERLDAQYNELSKFIDKDILAFYGIKKRIIKLND